MFVLLILNRVMLMKKRAPILGGSFALWGGLFSSCECTLIHLRNKEDFINPVASGFLTGGLLAARGKHFYNLI
jgi:mitochondrial import inner membrane translocase subunit TIM17